MVKSWWNTRGNSAWIWTSCRVHQDDIGFQGLLQQPQSLARKGRCLSASCQKLVSQVMFISWESGGNWRQKRGGFNRLDWFVEIFVPLDPDPRLSPQVGIKNTLFIDLGRYPKIGWLDEYDSETCHAGYQSTRVKTHPGLVTSLMFVGYMGVSWNRGTPKSSILMGFSLTNYPLSIFGYLHLGKLPYPYFQLVEILPSTPSFLPAS